MGFPTHFKLGVTLFLLYASFHRHIFWEHPLKLGQVGDARFSLQPETEYLRGQLNGALVVALLMFVYVFAERGSDTEVSEVTERAPKGNRSPSPTPRARSAAASPKLQGRRQSSRRKSAMRQGV